MTADWNLETLAQALGVAGIPGKPGVIGFDLAHQSEGIRLRLEVAPAHHAIRLYCQRKIGETTLVLSRTDLFGIAEITSNDAEGTVRFHSRGTRTCDVVVREDASFEMFIGAETPRQTIEAPPLPLAEDGLVHLVGRLARPRYSNRTGKPFFSAGLAQYPDGGVVPIWYSLKAFDQVAEAAQDLQRGQTVHVAGHQRQEHFRDGTGVDQQRSVLILSSIEVTQAA